MSNEKDLQLVNNETGEIIEVDNINLDMGEELAHIQIKSKTINMKDSKQSFKSFKASIQFMYYKPINEASDLLKEYLDKSINYDALYDSDIELYEQLMADLNDYNSKDNFYLVSEEPVSLWVDCKFIQDIKISRDCTISNVQNLKTGELAVKVKDIDCPMTYKVTLQLVDSKTKGEKVLKYIYPVMWIKSIEGFKPFYSAVPSRFSYKGKKKATDAETN